jgi:hypothetical protein
MIAEPIARQANREDQVSGRFWEGRFRSVKLCDEAAILVCCGYVDLNSIRAGIASTPEASDFTSVQRRIEGRKVEAAGPRSDSFSTSGVNRPDNWLAPVPLNESTTAPGASSTCEAATAENDATESSLPAARCSNKGFLPLTLDEYLELLDWTGRHAAPGKTGAIPSDEPPILERLGIRADDWLTLATGFRRMFARVAGRPSSVACQRHRRTHRRFRPGHARLLAGAA